MNQTLQHLVLVRHGESEGDIRRAAWRRGEAYTTSKTPENEELTAAGEEQSRLAGKWITKNIMAQLGVDFDGCLVSSAIRSEQTALSLDLPELFWQEDHCLDERNRGQVRGLSAAQHRQSFPESYAEMKANPLYWQPPGGESIMQVVTRVNQFIENLDGYKTVLAVTHRDWMWAAMQPLEGLSEEALLGADTDAIHNGQIIHYTSINPESGEQASALLWKRSIDPVQSGETAIWQRLSTDPSLT